MAALASYPGLEPAENILSLILANADVQSIAERLDVFYILILVRHMSEKTDGRAAQLEDSSIQPRA